MPPPMDDHEDLRRYQAPYSARRPVPTISRYREEKAARQAESLKTDPHDDATLAQPDAGQQAGGNGPDSSETRAEERPSDCGAQDDDVDDDDDVHGRGEETAAAPPEAFEDTSQVDPTSTDIKQRRRDLKARKKERAERLVTDPVTHLPVTIQDYTDEALKETVFSHPAFKADKRTAAATSIRQHADDNAEGETLDLQREHDVLQSRFPLPDLDVLRHSVATINSRGHTFGLAGVALVGRRAAVHRAQNRQHLPGRDLGCPPPAAGQGRRWPQDGNHHLAQLASGGGVAAGQPGSLCKPVRHPGRRDASLSPKAGPHGQRRGHWPGKRARPHPRHPVAAHCCRKQVRDRKSVV